MDSMDSMVIVILAIGFAKFFPSNVSFGLDVESTASWGTETANSRNDWTSNRRSTSSICPCGVLLVMFYIVFTPCGRESVARQPNLQDLYEIGCDRMWWHLNTSSDVVVPNARMHVYIIQYRTMLVYSFNHSYYFPLLPDHIINSLPVGSSKKNIQTWHGIWCDPTQSRCFSMSVTGAARFQTAILFFCIADLANIVSWLKNFRFMIGDWTCLFVAMETWPTTKAPRKTHKKREMDMETVGEISWRNLSTWLGIQIFR